jgi:glycosyltransferase involved in cell wall biosynthesis
VHEVGLGVDVAVFIFDADGGAARGDAPTVCYSGRFTVDKEIPLLLAAFDRVHAATGARLLFVGDGPLRARLVEFARSRPAVTVRPYLDDASEVARVLAAVDVVVVPSRAETFSLSTAEAIACGALVVGPDEGAVADLVRGTGAGACFRAGDAGSLGDALLATLALDRAARRARGVEGRARLVERYTWSSVMARIYDVYRDAQQAPLRSCG